ncbi:hypothetical protein AVEN_204381-1 [Araneus ventricosus]|uniref:Tetratricopeptide repeat protein n=1 Tax=Araneus ventricosus TaxID=182803 RepID=A0A4Y2KEH2_ARAVE|nr:hypothetical protein AVEN_204381-1 [Araneus ventricosus]
MRSVIRAKNQKGKTLIELAHICGFPKTDQLEMLFETDLVPKFKSAKKLLLEHKFVEAILALDNIFSKSVAIFGEDSEPVLRVREYIGQISESQGNRDKALHLYREVHEIRKNKLGEDHLRSLSVHTHIAVLLSNQGKTEEALQIFERVYIKLKEKLEPDDMNMILFKKIFSSLLFPMKKFDEVLKINVEIQQNCAQKREDIYRIILADSLYLTAVTLTEQNKLFEALKLFVTVYETRKDVFTLHNLGTLEALWKVAEILANLGLFDESLKMFEDVLDIQKSFLPENHFDILGNKFLVGKAFFKQGMLVTALKIILSLKPKIAVLAPDSSLMKANVDILEDIKNSLSTSNLHFLIDAIQNNIREED